MWQVSPKHKDNSVNGWSYQELVTKFLDLFNWIQLHIPNEHINIIKEPELIGKSLDGMNYTALANEYMSLGKLLNDYRNSNERYTLTMFIAYTKLGDWRKHIAKLEVNKLYQELTHIGDNYDTDNR